MTTTQQNLAEKFRALHVPGNPVLLANAWDPASAALFERAGFEAIATTSGGVAWANGVPDGNQLSAEALLAAVDKIARVVTIPLSIDIEGGLSRSPGAVGQLVAALADRGVAGHNLEDSWDGELLSIDEQRARVAAAKAAASTLFLNARIDTFFFGAGGSQARLDEAVERALAYVDAGADGVFVSGLVDLDLIGQFVTRVPVPVNIMTGLDGPTVTDLAKVGVARVSVGTALAEAAYTHAYERALQLRGAAPSTASAAPIMYPELNDLLRR